MDDPQIAAFERDCGLLLARAIGEMTVSELRRELVKLFRATGADTGRILSFEREVGTLLESASGDLTVAELQRAISDLFAAHLSPASPKSVATLPLVDPPASAPQVEPVTLSLPDLAPSTRQEPPMSDLVATLSRALPAALSLYRVSLDDAAISELTEAVADTARRAALLARRGPLSESQRAELQRDACDQAQCVLPSLPSEALQTIGEIVIDAIDARTHTGPLEEIDGEIAKRGLAALLDKIALWTEPDSGNLEARAQRARRKAARLNQEADQLEKIAAMRRARR